MSIAAIIKELKLWIFGPCGLPGGRCIEPGSKAFYPHSESRPIWLCPSHEAIARNRKKNGTDDGI